MQINEFNRYAKKVALLVNSNRQTKKRLMEDILEALYARYEETGETDPQAILGKPMDVAKEFAENLDIISLASKKEYKSEVELFGLPLVHIVYTQNGVAKGIIAIGPIAIGVLSLGGFAIGGICLGGFSLGLISLGGMSIGYSLAFGGVAIAKDIAIGGIAIAKDIAFGAVALAKNVAIGDVTRAKLMGYDSSYTIPASLDESTALAFKYPMYKKELFNAFKDMFPDFGFIKTWLMSLITK